jgi:hypothetical protein
LAPAAPTEAAPAAALGFAAGVTAGGLFAPAGEYLKSLSNPAYTKKKSHNL